MTQAGSCEPRIVGQLCLGNGAEPALRRHQPLAAIRSRYATRIRAGLKRRRAIGITFTYQYENKPLTIAVVFCQCIWLPKLGEQVRIRTAPMPAVGNRSQDRTRTAGLMLDSRLVSESNHWEPASTHARADGRLPSPVRHTRRRMPHRLRRFGRPSDAGSAPIFRLGHRLIAMSWNSRAGRPPPCTDFIGRLSSLPSQTPMISPSMQPMNQASR